MDKTEATLAANLLLPPGAVLACGALGELEGPLYPEERPFIARAVEKRRKEFTAGRTVARRTLAYLNLPPEAILQAEDRAPIWPATVTGSISHSDFTAIAVLALRSDCCGMGIDIESVNRVEPGLWPALFSSSEQASLRESPPWTSALFFSAKEAFYKLQYPQTRRMLDFLDLEVRLESDCHCRLTMKNPLPDLFREGGYEVTYVFTGDEVISFCHLQESGGAQRIREVT